MARWVSFIVLAGIVVLVAVLFFQVMASFILPMFFALILVVMFRPLHRWMTERCRGRVRLAAGITTALTMLIVFLPLLVVLSIAATEAVNLLTDLNRMQIVDKINDLRERFAIELPAPEARRLILEIDESVIELERRIDGEDDPRRIPGTLHQLRDQIEELNNNPALAERRVKYGIEDTALVTELPATEGAVPEPDDNAETMTFRGVSEEAAPLARVQRRLQAVWNDAVKVHEIVDQIPLQELGEPGATIEAAMAQLKNSDQLLQAAFRDFEWQLMGGGFVDWLKLQAYPSDERLDDLRNSAQEWLLPLALSTPSFLGGFLGRFFFGLVVMVISLYYFLADGPSMVAAIMRLSPLEDRYESRMLVEFDKISRAMVVATLLSAVVQGLLAGIGYYLAGLEAVFLLIVLTMFLSMVPFVGAASVWGACSLWLFFDGHVGAAVFLALYGALVVSMIDNFIKPYVLHGRSNLHPLLALLSVLGGVQALGPIGIFVGPMVVSFLQALLEMLRGELDSLDRGSIRQTT